MNNEEVSITRNQYLAAKAVCSKSNDMHFVLITKDIFVVCSQVAIVIQREVNNFDGYICLKFSDVEKEMAAQEAIHGKGKVDILFLKQAGRNFVMQQAVFTNYLNFLKSEQNDARYRIRFDADLVSNMQLAFQHLTNSTKADLKARVEVLKNTRSFVEFKVANVFADGISGVVAKIAHAKAENSYY